MQIRLLTYNGYWSLVKHRSILTCSSISTITPLPGRTPSQLHLSLICSRRAAVVLENAFWFITLTQKSICCVCNSNIKIHVPPIYWFQDWLKPNTMGPYVIYIVFYVVLIFVTYWFKTDSLLKAELLLLFSNIWMGLGTLLSCTHSKYDVCRRLWVFL